MDMNGSQRTGREVSRSSSNEENPLGCSLKGSGHDSIGRSTCCPKCRIHQVASRCTWTGGLNNGPKAREKRVEAKEKAKETVRPKETQRVARDAEKVNNEMQTRWKPEARGGVPNILSPTFKQKKRHQLKYAFLKRIIWCVPEYLRRFFAA